MALISSLRWKNDQEDGLKEGGKPSQTLIYLLNYILNKFQGNPCIFGWVKCARMKKTANFLQYTYKMKRQDGPYIEFRVKNDREDDFIEGNRPLRNSTLSSWLYPDQV